MKSKLLICAVVLALTSGCAVMRDFAKAAARMGAMAGREAVLEQWPGMKIEILDAAEELVDAGVGRACDYAEKKTNELADKWIESYEDRTGISIEDFDIDGDGVLSFGEAVAAFELVNKKSAEREEEGEDPIPWQVRYGETAALVLMLLAGIKGTKWGGKKLASGAAAVVKKVANGEKVNV